MAWWGGLEAVMGAPSQFHRLRQTGNTRTDPIFPQKKYAPQKLKISKTGIPGHTQNDFFAHTFCRFGD